MKDAVLIGDLHGVGDASKNVDHHYRAVPGLDFHPCSQLILLGKNLFEFCLYLTAGVVIAQSGQERSELPWVMLNGVQMILIFIVAGMVGGSALDLFIQFLFQLLVVGFGSPDVPVLCGVDCLPGYLRGAGKQNGTGRKCRHDQQQEQKKNAHDQKNVRVTFCKIGNAVDCGADYRFSFVDDLFHAGLCRSGAIGYRFTACGLCRCTRMGGGIVALPDVLLLPPPGKPVGTALAGAGCACILCCSRLLRGRFCGFGTLLALHLGFLFQLPSIDALGNIPDISCCLFALA